MSMSDSNYSADERLQGSEFSEILVYNTKPSSKGGLVDSWLELGLFRKLRLIIPFKT